MSNPGSTWLCPYFDARGDLNYIELERFLDLFNPQTRRFLDLAYPEHKDIRTKLFSGDYSVGFAQPHFQKGDEIFATDGARTPFILRRTGTQDRHWRSTDLPCYRIVSECYFWAALELDCSNLGTKLG
jgi:hypothetical protein